MSFLTNPCQRISGFERPCLGVLVTIGRTVAFFHRVPSWNLVPLIPFSPSSQFFTIFFDEQGRQSIFWMRMALLRQGKLMPQVLLVCASVVHVG
jgi:hypothetical protein